MVNPVFPPGGRRPRHLAAWSAAFLLALAGVVPLAGTERFSGETTHVVAVDLPVQVIQDGEPVRGLTAADFEVFEGRKKLKVTSFEAVDLGVAPAPGAAVAPRPLAARRHFLFLFDLTFAAPKSILKSRQAATDLVAKSLDPSDLVAVATYSHTQGPRLALGFTGDRRQITAAIRTLGVAQPYETSGVADPLHLVIDNTDSSQSVARSGGAASRLGVRGSIDEDLLESLQSVAAQSLTEERQQQSGRVIALTRAFSDLAKMMGNVSGRKYVVYLSEGFDSSLAIGNLEDNHQRITENIDIAAVTPWQVNNDSRFGNGRTLNQLELMFDQFRRNDCVIQAVDIGGLRAEGDLGNRRASGKLALFSMAKETGGELYENWNDLGAAMGQMLKRTSVTYMLTLEPEDLKLDGAYHALKVQLKNAPRGARVVARPGFYAPRPFSQENPLEKVFEAADSIIGGIDSGAVQSAFLAAPFALAGTAKAYVPLVIDIDGKSLLEKLPGNVLPTEVYVYALDGTGAIRDFFNQNMGFDLAKAGAQLKAGGLKFFGHLELAPGDYSVRVLVRNAKTGAYSLRVLPVHVPAFAAAGAAPFLLPPFFPEPAGRWLMARETARGDARDVPYPFESQHKPFIPASRPVLASGQESQFSLVAYNLGDGEALAGARVLAADGKEIPGASVRLLHRERGGPPAAGPAGTASRLGRPDRLLASLTAPQLAPGDYRLVVSLSAGGATETSSILFTVAKTGQGG